MSEQRPTPAAAARMPADLTGRDSARNLAGLIDVLDRADGGTARRRPHPRHVAAARAAAYRSGAVRTVPLRSVRPAPPARPAPVPFRAQLPAAPAPAAVPAAQNGLLARVTRRVAFWGAGPDGAHLAWGPSTPVTPTTPRRTPAPATGPRPRTGLLTALHRRIAFWGAGLRGEYLAWSTAPQPRPAAAISLRWFDGPVVLHELPSTPTVQPVTSSPVAALVPGPAFLPADPVAPPALVGHRPPAPPVAESEPAGPRVPVQSARTPQPTGWPQRPPRSSSRPARSFPTPTGLARARGDPSPYRARGSPRPPPCRAVRLPG
jgi:hypothetical protein